MAWFAAHAIIYFKIKDNPQDVFTVWENVYLIQAESSELALSEALRLGTRDEGDDDNSLTVDDQPAIRVFAGIRKVVSVSHIEIDGQLTNGDEITYSEFQVENEEDAKKLANDEEVFVRYVG